MTTKEISTSEKSKNALGLLISSGYYKGAIHENGFELVRDAFPVNNIVSGKLTDNGNYVVKSHYKYPVSIKILLISFSLICLVFLLKGNMIFFVFLGLFLVFFIGMHHSNSKKEVKFFMNKYLSFYST